MRIKRSKQTGIGIDEINSSAVYGGKNIDISICCIDIPPMHMSEQEYKNVLI